MSLLDPLPNPLSTPSPVRTIPIISIIAAGLFCQYRLLLVCSAQLRRERCGSALWRLTFMLSVGAHLGHIS